MHVGGEFREIRTFINAEVRSGFDITVLKKRLMLGFQEKPLSDSLYQTVPQTDTGRQVEDTKVHERTRVKELGKMVP